MPIGPVWGMIARMTEPGTKQRVAWIDIAKGIAILLVVLHHSIRFLQGQGFNVGQWETLNLALQTFRMPLFFAAAGLLFHRNLALPWRDYMIRKALPFLYLYVLWSILVGFYFWPMADKFEGEHPMRGLALALVAPSNHLWFIYGLFVYFVAVKALDAARIPAGAQVAGAAVLGAVFGSSTVMTGSWTWDNILTYFVFFVVAVHYRAAIDAVVARSTWPRMIGAALLWGAMVGVTFKAGLGINNWVRIPLSAVAVVFGFLLAAQLARTVLAGAATYFGTHTREIYLLHGFGRGVLVWFVAATTSAVTVVSLVMPIVITAALTGFALAVWWATRNVPGLFSAPWLRGDKREVVEHRDRVGEVEEQPVVDDGLAERVRDRGE